MIREAGGTATPTADTPLTFPLVDTDMETGLVVTTWLDLLYHKDITTPTDAYLKRLALVYRLSEKWDCKGPMHLIRWGLRSWAGRKTPGIQMIQAFRLAAQIDDEHAAWLAIQGPHEGVWPFSATPNDESLSAQSGRSSHSPMAMFWNDYESIPKEYLWAYTRAWEEGKGMNALADPIGTGKGGVIADRFLVLVKAM